ncbi:protocadherin Fat 4 [Athalia rosae]|uniref:protocadherin Fat 4 n=1 Tax=Athalia rosae TaxID=37344 RepID=UPI0020346B7A|nr:protocadherin Fat 4 [Athalia rosae]XP_020711398.2 protocadherin Fat 4 [Athalia rosae]XP_020711399.2 protocadherin Fat 4 [Athalia rosae]
MEIEIIIKIIITQLLIIQSRLVTGPTDNIHANAQLIRDTRCFLENGATAAHLFVGEEAEVGAVVGVIGVIGDPVSPGESGTQGDIELRLKERDSPVAIYPGSKNLTLTRPLDKEGVEGPASVYVNVICERRHTHDPGFVIPVNIRVTDANDNAPQFINAPYVLNISEVTVVGTRVLQGVRAVDADQPGPYSTVEYSVLPGPHADYFVFVNALEGTLVLRKPLDYETLSNFSVGIHAQDQGNPPQTSDTVLMVNVIDADDQNPAFLNDQYKLIIPSSAKTEMVLLVSPAPIRAVDQDTGINSPVRYSLQGAAGGAVSFLTLNPGTGDVVLSRIPKDHELLAPATLVIKATQIDNPDRYALATVVVSRDGGLGAGPTAGGRLPVRFVLKDYQASVPENTPPGSILLTAGVNKIDPNLRFWLVGAVEDLERFAVTRSGELILKGTLDYERRIQHSFLVHVSDGHHNDTSRVNVSVEDVNEWEPRFRHPRYELHARTLRQGSIVGRLEAADGDRGDRVTLSLRGPDARSFEIRDNGELILTSPGPFNGTMARLVAIAADSGRPPRSSMVPVIVHLPNAGSLPIAARAAPAWLGSSVLLVAVFGAVLGLLGVVILVLILYIYKHKRPKSSGSVSSSSTGYRDKSPIPSALSPTPRVLGASPLRGETSGEDRRDDRIPKLVNDVDNPVFGDDNESAYNTATIKSVTSARQMPLQQQILCGRHKVGPLVVPPAAPTLSATSHIPNLGGLVQNINNLSGGLQRGGGIGIGRHVIDSSNDSVDPPDSLQPPGSAWPQDSVSRRVKKLSWDDDDDVDDLRPADDDDEVGGSRDKVVESVDVSADVRRGNFGLQNPTGINDQLNLTVYF